MADEIGPAMAQVEVNAIQAVTLHLGVDRARHDIARRQFGVGTVALHERLAARQLQDCALAAQCFGDQERLGLGMVEAGGMELENSMLPIGTPAR